MTCPSDLMDLLSFKLHVYNTYSAKVNDEAVTLVETVPAQGHFCGPDHSPTLHMQEPLGSQVICENMIQSRCHTSRLNSGKGTEKKTKHEASKQTWQVQKTTGVYAQPTCQDKIKQLLSACEKLNVQKRIPWQINRFSYSTFSGSLSLLFEHSA